MLSCQPFTIIKNCRQLMAKDQVAQASIHSNRWTITEQKQYLAFFSQNMSLAENKKLRKSHMIFHKMSAYIKTRTPIQIKSHHQKVLQKYGSLKEGLKYIQKGLKKLQCSEIQHIESQGKNITQSVETQDWEEKRSKVEWVRWASNLSPLDIFTWPDRLIEESDNYLQESF